LPYEELATAIKKELSNIGYSIARFPEDAEYRLIIKSSTREAGNMGQLYFSYVDITWVVYNKEGDEVATETMSPIKGGALSYDDASVKAYHKASTVLSTRILDLLKKQNKQ